MRTVNKVSTNVKYLHCFPQTVRDHRLLSRVADIITTWDGITSLGLELSCNPNDVARLRSENRSIKGAAYAILRSFYIRHTDSTDAMIGALRNALKELGKEALLPTVGLEELKFAKTWKLIGEIFNTFWLFWEPYFGVPANFIQLEIPLQFILEPHVLHIWMKANGSQLFVTCDVCSEANWSNSLFYALYKRHRCK